MGAAQLVKITELKLHDLVQKLSPWMSERRWQSWVDRIAHEGIFEPIHALPDGRVFNGKHRLHAAKELGLAEVAVIFEDITDEEVAQRIVADKLGPELHTLGQRIAIAINQADEEGVFAEAEARIQAAGAHGSEGGRGNKKETPRNQSSEGFKERPRDTIATRLDISVKPIQQVLTIRKERPDLYLRIFDGWYDERGKEVAVGTIYRKMKDDEKRDQGIDPDEQRLKTKQERAQRKIAEAVSEQIPKIESLPDKKEEESPVSANNRLLHHLKNELKPFMSDYATAFGAFLNSTDDEVKSAYLDNVKTVAELSLRILLVNDKENLLKLIGGIEDEK
ncbi:ParB N-terminal domain-containing protein [Brevibacillus laterosporus]|uniref:ParB N-terminal domain-containing protein n=1 Tax=Brevibacillus laterosporus TaxID=1465 RepID=A0AAP3DJ64_BRELA|nr:ParB N-terminal domain-containing protein [Brevibacillus laterosporus]MCR8982294.1 ParB N-terminal domain-containing protein [Brevibacillus laterosporus]MCZ0809449.1 ParB N-terminal domain-containing protein [Brevibacillus laterosporus]MCZ0827836.1 ParB N-terminal domain-containing protein [Brevibacillus laterosporus]MCZ0851776.1 ParB N-terminal domain-containing protein [Brevibacillus laterosporus]